jgi:hypothetical protein
MKHFNPDEVLALGKRSPDKPLTPDTIANKVQKLEEVEMLYNDMVLYNN